MFHDWMVQPIPAKPLLSSRRGSAYETRELLEGDSLIDAMPLRPGVPAARFAQGAVCLGTFKKEELVGYIWLSFETYLEDEVRCTFILEPQSESVFDFDLYILEKYRLGMAFAAVWDGASNYLRARGVEHSYSRVDHFNQASVSAHNHLGWKRVGSAIILKLWTVEVVLADIKPRVSLLLTENQRAQISLNPDVLKEAS